MELSSHEVLDRSTLAACMASSLGSMLSYFRHTGTDMLLLEFGGAEQVDQVFYICVGEG